jgi:DNA-binding LacI/PurR family transcriptional regulator
MKMANQVTAKEIAKKLGISTASVSVALNGKPGVSEQTRKRILDAAEEMGYSSAKTPLPDRKQLCFLIYVDQIVGIAQESTFYTIVMKGVETAAKALGYRILVRYYYAGQSFRQQMADIMGDISGLLILGTDMTLARHKLGLELTQWDRYRVPVVILDNFLFSAYVDCVGNDNLYGAKSAMSYLIDCGHRRFGYLRAKQRIVNFDDREHGLRMALREHLDDENAQSMEIIHVDISAEKAYRDIGAWIAARKELPSALFAENDVVAAAAIRALHAAGLNVPEDISVMGFDDIPLCEMVDPGITTVHSFKEQLGIEAVRMLHQRIERGETVRCAQETGVVKLSLSMRIVERGSVAKLAGK